jgi:hypothetical protein
MRVLARLGRERAVTRREAVDYRVAVTDELLHLAGQTYVGIADTQYRGARRAGEVARRAPLRHTKERE